MPDETFDQLERVETVRDGDAIAVTTPDGEEHVYDHPSVSGDEELEIRFGDTDGLDYDYIGVDADGMTVRSFTGLEVDADRVDVTAVGAAVEVDAEVVESATARDGGYIDADARTVGSATGTDGGEVVADADRLAEVEARNGGSVTADVDGLARIETGADPEWVIDAGPHDETRVVLEDVERVGRIEASDGVVAGSAGFVEDVSAETRFGLPTEHTRTSDPTGARNVEPFVEDTTVALSSLTIERVSGDRATFGLDAERVGHVEGTGSATFDLENVDEVGTVEVDEGVEVSGLDRGTGLTDQLGL